MKGWLVNKSTKIRYLAFVPSENCTSTSHSLRSYPISFHQSPLASQGGECSMTSPLLPSNDTCSGTSERMRIFARFAGSKRRSATREDRLRDGRGVSGSVL